MSLKRDTNNYYSIIQGGAKMAVFRIEKTRDYTVMANHHLRNKALSLKAKGLLSLMLSLPEDWDYTTRGLSCICKDGVDSIRVGIQELEANGYLVRERRRNENGQYGAIEYTILEKPRQVAIPPPVQEKPILENPTQVIPMQVLPTQEIPAQLSIEESNTQKSNTDESNTHSFFPSDAQNEGQTEIRDVRDTDSTFNFLISLVYAQLFNLLCEKADDVYGGRLPVHVRCLIDECANIGQIPNLEKLVATIRSREISACLVLQAQSQLKALYKDNADTIVGNMDTSIFLGGKEPTTLKELAAALGKETVDTYNTGESRGRETSHSLNYQKLGRELMSVDELVPLLSGLFSA